ncbi:MAG: fumarylacetoacetate hydrolase family protein, partial [Burkholderiaceae bacterium]
DAIPTAACLPESLTFPSGSRMSHALAGLAGVESEVAFRISDVQWSTGSVRVLVDACCVALEVVASRFFDPDAISPWLKLADQQMNAALVLGPWQPLPEVPWGSLVCTASFDGAMLAESKQGHPCEDPLWALNWLADHANGQGLALRAGDVVTTGSWLGVLPIKQPGMFSASFSGLGEASLQFD